MTGGAAAHREEDMMREYVHNGFHLLLDEDDARRLGATPVETKRRPAVASKGKPAARRGGREGGGK